MPESRPINRGINHHPLCAWFPHGCVYLMIVFGILFLKIIGLYARVCVRFLYSSFRVVSLELFRFYASDVVGTTFQFLSRRQIWTMLRTCFFKIRNRCGIFFFFLEIEISIYFWERWSSIFLSLFERDKYLLTINNINSGVIQIFAEDEVIDIFSLIRIFLLIRYFSGEN